jgi:hypothetical protein
MILKKLTFEVTNCVYDTYLSDSIYCGDIMTLSINLLCDTNVTLNIIWSNDDYTLYTEGYTISGGSYFSKIINVKSSFFKLQLLNLTGSTFVLQTFYH